MILEKYLWLMTYVLVGVFQHFFKAVPMCLFSCRLESHEKTDHGFIVWPPPEISE